MTLFLCLSFHAALMITHRFTKEKYAIEERHSTCNDQRIVLGIALGVCFLIGFWYFLVLVTRMNQEQRMNTGFVAIAATVVFVFIYSFIELYLKKRKQRKSDK